jgi:RNA polymerase sigma factor (sigma-70 family)
MASTPMSRIIGHLRKAAVLQEGDRLTDAQLLESFLVGGEEVAFEALVRRHGPMILGVCRRVLQDRHDAEDAFQAAFLVFLRKAAAIGKRKSLASWLYGVAHRTALQARKKAAQRRAKERQVEMAQKQPTGDNAIQDMLPLLDQEMSRLPDKYRVPIILCDLEGKTRKAAAQQLDLPEKTLSTRLDRARVMLAKRLARHGTILSSSALALAISQNMASASVPHALVSSTVKIASLVVAGKTGAAAAISAKVAVLTEGVVKTMLLTKLKTMAAVLVVVTALGTGVGTLGHMALAENQPATNLEGEKSRDRAKEAAPDEQGANGQGIEKPGVEKQFESAPGHTWFQRPVKFDGPRDSGSIQGNHFAGGSLTITQMPNGSLLLILVGAEPTVKQGTNYRPVAFDRDGKRFVAYGWGGGSSKNAGLSLFTLNYVLDAKDLPAAKVAYLGIEAETVIAKQFEDFAQWKFGGGGAHAIGIKDKGGFTVVPMEAPKGRAKLCLSFALAGERAGPSDFRVMAVDADGKRHEAQGKGGVSAGGKGTAVITMVLEFNLGSDAIRDLVVQRAKSK